MDHSRNRGQGAALLEPENEPDAARAAVAESTITRDVVGDAIAVVNELRDAAAVSDTFAVASDQRTGNGVNTTETVHSSEGAPALQGRARRVRAAIASGARGALRQGRALARRAAVRMFAVARATPGALRRALPRTWGWVWAHATPGRLIGLLAGILSVGFYAWYAGRGLTLAYNDAITHMLIARRVLMGRTPGLAQLGTVWPPLTHILMLPFVWNETLFRSGLAGALPSMAAYVIGAVALNRLGALAFGSRVAGVAAALTLMLNPDVLYMQSTPMTEMGLICCAIVALYYLLRWARDLRPLDLVKTALAVAAGSLIRYDAWALALALLSLVAYVAWRARGRWFAEASVLVFAMLGFAGCVAWVFYNQVIFGDALAFLRGPYSSAVQQQIVAAGNGLPTRGNVWLSFLVYGTASLDSVGWVVAGVALVGAVWWCWRERLQLRALPLYAVWVPFFFNWYSLFNGTSTLDTVEFPVAGMRTFFNERYGMMMIPAAALFVGCLAGALVRLPETRAYARTQAWFVALVARNGRTPVRPYRLLGRIGRIPMRPYALVQRIPARLRWQALALAPLLVVALASASITFGGTPYALQDPLHGISAGGRTQVIAETAWLTAHVHSGTILAGYSSFGSTIFLSGFPDNTFLTDSDGPLFQAALAHPERAVSWIMMDTNGDPRDPVWQALHNRQNWRQYFVLRAVVGSAEIYQRLSTGGAT